MSSIVLGAGYGDEGKGLVTSWLCSKNNSSWLNREPFVVRFSGGQQAGHTVVLDRKRHVFSNFGSGTLQGVPTYWSKYCTFYPLSFMNEYHALRMLGVKPVFYIDPRCPVTTPYDVFINRNNERQKGNTVGMGIGQTWDRHKKHYKLILQDLFCESVWREKLKLIQYSHYYKYFSSGYSSGITEKISEEEVEYFIECIAECKHIIKPISNFGPVAGTNFICEGSQGILLDQDHGFFPYVTRGNTTSKNAIKLLKRLNPSAYTEVYYVTRSYQTRHGAGFISKDPINVDPCKTNVTNPYQGKFFTNELDVDMLFHAIRCDTLYSHGLVKNLVITHTDQVAPDLDLIRKTAEDKGIHFAGIYLSKGPEPKDIYLS